MVALIQLNATTISFSEFKEMCYCSLPLVLRN